MLDELRVLSYDSMYPVDTGYNVRVMNLAKIMAAGFRKTTVYSIDNLQEYNGQYHGMELMQVKKYKSAIGKYLYYLSAYLHKDFVPACSPLAFKNVLPSTIYQIEGPYYYPLLKKLNIKKYVMNEHNVYWELHQFHAYSLKNKLYFRLTNRREYLNEIKAIENASHILTCSERDRSIILEHVPSAAGHVSVVPNCVDFESFDDYARHYVFQPGKVPKVLFMGTYGYDPNIDALYTICNIIAPGVGPDIQFIAAGKNPPQILHPDNVIFTGYVNDLKKAILDSDICIAPLRYGSGTRLKILEYMALGKPVISTSKGAEGIDYADGVNIIIEDDLSKYPVRIQELIEDEARMRRIGSSAKELIKNKYNWKHYQGDLIQIYERVANEN